MPWSDVEPLPEEIGGLTGNGTPKVLKEQLAEFPPVDLEDILEELEPEHRMVILSELDAEQASDRLEALEPRVQRDLIASLNKEKAAGLVDEMTPNRSAIGGCQAAAGTARCHGERGQSRGHPREAR